MRPLELIKNDKRKSSFKRTMSNTFETQQFKVIDLALWRGFWLQSAAICSVLCKEHSTCNWCGQLKIMARTCPRKSHQHFIKLPVYLFSSKQDNVLSEIFGGANVVLWVLQSALEATTSILLALERFNSTKRNCALWIEDWKGRFWEQKSKFEIARSSHRRIFQYFADVLWGPTVREGVAHS